MPAVKFDAPAIRSMKMEITLQLTNAPVTPASYSHEPFLPYKATVTDFGNRARVQLVGRRTNGMDARSATFKIRGYERYLPVPDWLKPLIVAAGYGGTFDE